jgi:hypothetical protein
MSLEKSPLRVETQLAEKQLLEIGVDFGDSRIAQRDGDRNDSGNRLRNPHP